MLRTFSNKKKKKFKKYNRAVDNVSIKWKTHEYFRGNEFFDL